MPDTTNPTVGHTAAARRTYDGTYADLAQILAEWDVAILDEVDPGGHRNPFVGPVDLEKSGLLDALWGWQQAAVGAAALAEFRAGAAFPGVPGSRWRDGDGDIWVHGADGRMWLTGHQGHDNNTPEEAERFHGPMTRAERS